MFAKVSTVLDIPVPDVEPFTNGTNVVGWTLGFEPKMGCIGMNIVALMKKHYGFIHHILQLHQYKRMKKFGQLGNAEPFLNNFLSKRRRCERKISQK